MFHLVAWGLLFACSSCAALVVRAVYLTVLVWFAIRLPTRHAWNNVLEVSVFLPLRR